MTHLESSHPRSSGAYNSFPNLLGEPGILIYATLRGANVKPVELSSMTKYFLFATVLSFIAAVAFTVPVIVPEFTFPLELTIWPGTWMFEAYFAFLIVGVLGNLGWAALLDLAKRNTGKEHGSRYLSFAHIALSNIGVYGATSFMFAVGYLGGYGALVGYGRAVITQAIIGWMVVPIGVFIYLYIIASVLGAVNLFLVLGTDRLERQPTVAPSDLRRSDFVFWGGFVALVSLIFVLLPIIEIPYYPSNYFQELTVMSASAGGLIAGLALLAFGGLRKARLGNAMAAAGEQSASV
jgi:hypothetical protein